MAVQFNAEFNRFVDFANALKGSGKAIADVANGSFDVRGLSRSVVAASGDKVGAFFRSQAAKDVNNVTRDTFYNAVVDMFGGESRIPASVKNAMEMKNFDGSGRPLTAKRILIVKAAIDTYNAQNSGLGVNVEGPGSNIINEGLKENPAKMNGVKAMSAASAARDMKPVALTQKMADKLINKSLDLFGWTMKKDVKDKLSAMLLKYGDNMPAKNQRMLSNYIVNKELARSDDDSNDVEANKAFEEDVAAIAGHMSKWSDIKFGDPRLNGLGAKFIQRQNDYIKVTIDRSEKFVGNNKDVFEQLDGDSYRGNWNINGKVFKASPNVDVTQRKQDVVDSFLKAVKNPNARKVISILMNQSSLADVEHGLMRKISLIVGDPQNDKPTYEDVHKFPGAEMFVAGDEGSSLSVGGTPSFDLEISKDGKTATVTVSVDKEISTNGTKYNEFKIGTVKVAQKTKLDLTKDMPEILDITFSQTYSPDKIRRDPSIGDSPL